MKSIYFSSIFVTLIFHCCGGLQASSIFRKCYWCSHASGNVRLVHPEFPLDKSCEDLDQLKCKLSLKQCSNPSDVCIKFSTIYDITTFNATGRGCITMSKGFPKGCTNTTANVLRNHSTHSLIWQLEGNVEFCACDEDGCNGNNFAEEMESQTNNKYVCHGRNLVERAKSDYIVNLALGIPLFFIYLASII